MKQYYFVILTAICLSAKLNSAAQNPGAVSGAKLWLKANTGVVVTENDKVLRWNNQSSAADIIDEADTVSKNIDYIRLHAQEFNFNNALVFVGLDTAYLRGQATTGFNSTSTLFAVCRLYSLPNPTGETLFGVLTSRNHNTGGGGQGISVGGNTSSPYYMMDANGAQRGNTASANTSVGDLVLINGSYQDNTSTHNSIIYKNGTLEQHYTGGTPVSVTADCQYFEVGGRSFNRQADRAFSGTIAELIYYPSLLDTEDIKKIESYLALKYGITLGTGTDSNYISSNGTVIWEGNLTYQHDVFGLGRDDGSGLIIAQSNSMNTGHGDGKGQPGKGNIVIRNPSSNDNGDFLIIGHNTDPFTEQSTELPTDAIFTGTMRLQREWRVQHTNNVGSVDLSFYTNGLSLSGDLSNITLLISEGDDDFANGNYRLYTNPVLNDTILTFTGVTLNNNDYFSFITNLTEPLPQTGNYRSKTTGTWNNITSWETFDGTNWIDATLVPDDANANIITIRSGHNITQTVPGQTIDQVVVDNGGTLSITATTTLLDGNGADLIVNPTGTIHMTAGSLNGGVGTINNSGTISMTTGALFVADLINDGVMSFTATGSKTFSIPQFINNGDITWSTGGTLNFGTSNFINNGNLIVSITSDQAITGTGSMVNSSGGTITFNQSSIITISPSFTNNGTIVFQQGNTNFSAASFINTGLIKGRGIVAFSNLANTGTVLPGLSPGVLTFQTAYSGGALDLELVDASGPGTGHDQLAVIGTADISNVTLNIADAGVPIGDYVILTATGGVSGNFLNVATLPSNYVLLVNSNDVILRVTAVLPLRWISFSGDYLNSKVMLDWLTGSESNTGHFEIERSTDGRHFNVIGRISANGNTISNSNYQFTDAAPLTGTSYYRIKQVDLDGRFTYSTVISININNPNLFKAFITPNPARSVLNLVIEGATQREILLFELVNINGTIVHSERFISMGTSISKTIPRPAINAGIYFYRVTRLNNKQVTTGKISIL